MFEVDNNGLYVEKYRPTTLEGYVGNQHVIDKCKIWLEQGEIPHILLYGTAGTGKTTLAKILANSIDSTTMYLNCSDENSVDTVREKIKNFASTMSFTRWKVLVLDECLEAGTLVTVLRAGNEIKIPIETLDQDNDLVKSFNIETGVIEWQPFYLWDKGIQDIWEIELDNGEVVRCTEDHKWFVSDSDGTTVVVKTVDLHKYNHILSPF